MSARHRRSVLIAAWAIVLGMGGISVTFNVYHALHFGQLQIGLAVLLGLAPTLAAALLSHIAAAFGAGWVIRGITFAVMGGAMLLSIGATSTVVHSTEGRMAPLVGLVMDAATLVAVYVIMESRGGAAGQAAGDAGTQPRMAAPPSAGIPPGAFERLLAETGERLLAETAAAVATPPPQPPAVASVQPQPGGATPPVAPETATPQPGATPPVAPEDTATLQPEPEPRRSAGPHRVVARPLHDGEPLAITDPDLQPFEAAIRAGELPSQRDIMAVRGGGFPAAKQFQARIGKFITSSRLALDEAAG